MNNKAISLLLLALAFVCCFTGCSEGQAAYTLPPERTCTQDVIVNVKRLGTPTLLKDYREADAVCEITIDSWLFEDSMNTYHRAAVNRIYKGDIPETITFRQFGCSECPSDFPIYTHGNRLLVFLHKREDLDKEYGDKAIDAIYELTAHDLSALYIAKANDGKDYLIDYDVLLSYNTEEFCPEIALNNVRTSELMSELAKDLQSYDGLLAEHLINNSAPRSTEFGGIRIYDLQEFISLFPGLENVE